ncbi:MAG: FAD-dependent oxidoreductase [Methyloprofundus sp.]|nr:FAD-dependent oxidoreductase [Methyloprofundus sp.]
MHKKQVDIIVIGSGIGGLTSAGLLAKAGKKVLLLEQHDRAGGYAHGFKRKKYYFDAGVHLTSGCGATGYQGGQLIAKTLDALNVSEQVSFISINPFAHISLADISFDLPQSMDAFVLEAGKVFPTEQQGLRDLLALCFAVTEQAAQADDLMRNVATGTVPAELTLLFQYRYHTLAEVWGDFITEPQLKSIFAALWPYLGLPPTEVSFVYWANMLIGYLEDGAYYCQGGFQNLADALVAGLLKAGGEIRLKASVNQIKVIDNQVQGVQLATGEFIHANTVISNADMRHTVHQLVGDAHFPKRYLSRLARMQVSQSIFVVYIATDLDMQQAGAHHEAFYYQDYDHEKNYQTSCNAELSWLSITVPTLVDPSLAPQGEHLVMLTSLVSFDQYPDWKQEKAAFTEKMLDFADTKIAGLKAHILFIDAGSPTTLQRYTLNDKGAAYGWAASPQQTGAMRAANKAPITGLYFAGHWTTPGGGVYGASYSGVQTAQTILGLNKQADLWTISNE